MIAMARRALMALRKQAYLEHISDPLIMKHMFNTLVMPVMTYACELWGGDNTLVNQCERLHFTFLRSLYHLPACTDKMALLAELQETSMADRIHILQAKFWNRICDMATCRPSRLLALVASEHLAWNKKYTGTWSLKTRAALASGGIEVSQGEHIDIDDMEYMAAHNMDATFREAIANGTRDNRDWYRSIEYTRCDGERRRTYATYFWPKPQS